MNKGRMKVALTDAASKVQEQTGKRAGSTDQPVKGTQKQLRRQVQRLVGDMKGVH
jgi:uncharacterized protein YjbJ (UPF0337 family)